MGYTSYDSNSRSIRASVSGYYSKSTNDVFEQNKKRMIHESMEPKKAILREARDSDVHPLSVPIIIALDVTGSMGNIPVLLVKDGLPSIMSNIIQKGIKDPQVLFLAVGDTEYDRYPLQVGQFECGDVELDTWLTRTYMEGGGGGNDGESYLLAWYFAANHTVIDSFEKRKQKGFIFTIGDEPCLKTLPKNVITELMEENQQRSYTDKELLELAQEKYNVFHLHVMEGSAGRRSLGYWKDLMGQNCIQVDNHEDIPNKISETVISFSRTLLDEGWKELENSGLDKPLVQDKKSSDDIQEIML